MTTTSPAQLNPPSSSINPWLLRLPILFGSGVILLAVVWLLLLVGVQTALADRIVPGVRTMGVDLSGMSYEEAVDNLRDAFAYTRDTVFTLRYNDQVWQMSATELGLSFDAEATAARAAQVGHGRGIPGDIMEQAQAWFQGVSIAPVLTYNQGAALDRLQTIAGEIDQLPQEASLRIENGTVVTTEGQPGRQVDVMAALNEIETRLLNFGGGDEILLSVRETTPSTLSAADTASRIETALSGPVRLVATGANGESLGPWTLTVDQIAALLRIERSNGQYEAHIDMSAFADFLETLAPGLITSPHDGRFEFDEASGQLVVIEPAISGRQLNIQETLARLEEGVFSDNRVVPVAFDYTLPRFHNQITAAELGIREMVAESTTYFTGSDTNRRHNVALSAGKFNGVIIAPGEEFSFNGYLGSISEENGYREDKLIFGGRTIDGLGGGVCQTSTTVFRAAFTGGYAITERNSHGYRVGYYEQRGGPPGLDAAIWQPERDFRFQNNTPYHLLIETSVYPGEDALQFRFYSTRYFRTEIDAPIVKDVVPPLPTQYEANTDLQPGQSLQVDYAAEGADVTIYRRVYDLSGNQVIDDYIYTHYLPWAAIIQVAPGDPRLRSS